MTQTHYRDSVQYVEEPQRYGSRLKRCVIRESYIDALTYSEKVLFIR